MSVEKWCSATRLDSFLRLYCMLLVGSDVVSSMPFPQILALAFAELARTDIGYSWGPFEVAPIMRSGNHIGWGATCGQHYNDGDSEQTQCKIQLTFGAAQMGDSECRVRVKQWCLNGTAIEPGPTSRSQHLAMKPRRLELSSASEAELDRQAAALL